MRFDRFSRLSGDEEDTGESEVKRALIEIMDWVVLLADSKKFEGGSDYLRTWISLSPMRGARHQRLKRWKSAGIRVVIAETQARQAGRIC